MLVGMFDRLTQASSIVMGEQHLSEHSFNYRSMENRSSLCSLDGRIQPFASADRCVVGFLQQISGSELELSLLHFSAFLCPSPFLGYTAIPCRLKTIGFKNKPLWPFPVKQILCSCGWSYSEKVYGRLFSWLPGSGKYYKHNLSCLMFSWSSSL